MLRLLAGLSDDPDKARAPVKQAREMLKEDCTCTLPMAWALAGQAFNLNASDSLQAWLWAWFENQIAAAIKALPLGQQAGQRVTEKLGPALNDVAARATHLPPDEWTNFAPGFAMASGWHETQYSRLFRS